jgi:coenzyme F420-reducing hydrogenase alpha subunit
MDNDIQLISAYPDEAKIAMRLRDFGMSIVRVIGGRVIHPLTNEVGGFKKAPDADALRKIVADSTQALQDAIALGEFFKKIKIPDFQRETEYVSLDIQGEYAIYDGDIISSQGLHIPVEKFEQDFKELQKQNEVIKKVVHEGNSYMIGAIARINNSRKKLNPAASQYLESLNFVFPDYNPFHNILYQMVEVIHCIEQSNKLIKELLHSDLNNVVTREYMVKEGTGVAAVEAPRGTLYYHVDVDAKGYIKNVNIITPTAQFLANLEDDIADYIKEIIDLKDLDRQKKLRGFIRAYDPCISCAVH